MEIGDRVIVSWAGVGTIREMPIIHGKQCISVELDFGREHFGSYTKYAMAYPDEIEKPWNGMAKIRIKGKNIFLEEAREIEKFLAKRVDPNDIHSNNSRFH